MIDIAYVEDEPAEAERMKAYIAGYQNQTTENLKLQCFPDGLSFLEQAKKEFFDIIFLDIDMTGINGMEVAKRIRRQNNSSVIIFITNMAQFAVKGYEVEAMDFIVKPVRPSVFQSKLKRAIDHVVNLRGTEISVRSPEGLVRISCSTLLYVEIYGHTLIYHTESGNYETRGKLSDEEERLAPYHFIRCNKSFLVNMAQIRRAEKNELELLNGEILEISHPRKKSFMESLAKYLGSTG